MEINQGLSKSHRWKIHIDTWKSSGQSIRQWCQERNISTSTFAYWKDKFSYEKLDVSSFIEIAEEKSVGLVIKYKEFEVHIEKMFDEQTLCRCLKVIRSVLC